MTNDALITLNPFQNIGMAFSGGGFRAAAYALGTLSYLDYLKIDDKPLTERISFMSSASGGTITSMLFAAGLHQNVPFTDFYRKLYHDLNGEAVVELALATLNDESQWQEGADAKQRNLINSFAKAYDQVFFKQQTMSVFFEKTYRKKMEVCFNSTEFYRGLSFRFQTDGTDNQHQVIGNNYLWFDNKQMETFKKIKLGDVLAASSCFPIGFEPVVYPSDFSYSDSPEKTLSSAALKTSLYYENYNEKSFPLSFEPEGGLTAEEQKDSHISSFALMDGGITDNQGLYSLMLADKKRQRRVNPDPFDLMIVTDVMSYFMHAYESPVVEQKKGWREQNLNYFLTKFKKTAKNIKRSPLLFGLAFIVFAALGWIFKPSGLRLAAVILASVSATLAILTSLVVYSSTGKKLISNLIAFDVKEFLYIKLGLQKIFSKIITDKLAGYLQFTRLNILEQMIKARLTSGMTMVSEVNLKQVRRLIYQMFYDDTQWDNRRVPNFSYELSTYNMAARNNRFNNKNRLKWVPTPADKQLLLEGLEKIHPIADVTRAADTTLWYDAIQKKDEVLKQTVTTGQFSICVNLLEYVISLERKNISFNPTYSAELAGIKNKLERDFLQFKENPYFLFDQLAGD
ncbi:patatin-like phospholipase family protein [Pedobacter sp. FW305-3-2-15-E-R2A2]|uniref:patatin-like phospholipase family protein n=1 Tax=Pedobacter sp. FW305-3-2-15-E-R2A2 TaxID=3140251 RepID=UPI00314082A6